MPTRLLFKSQVWISWQSVAGLGLLMALGGCSSVRVRVDARVAADPELSSLLNGPDYVIRAADEQVEASLAWQEFAATLERALELRRPDLQRVSPAQPADFAILLHVAVADLGAGAVSYPVYGSHYGRGYGPCGPVWFHSHGLVGTEVRSVHFGWDHILSATAYVQDASAPAGRRVLWEAMAGTVAGRADLDAALPYLALAVSSYFSEATEGTHTLRFSRRSEDVKLLRKWARAGPGLTTRPAESP